MSTTEDLLRGTLHDRVAGRTADPNLLIAGTMTRYRRRRRRALLASSAVVVLAAGASAGSLAAVQVADRPAPSYALPTTGIPDDGPSDLAAVHGTFSAWMTPTGACAAIGQRNMAFVWPKGYRVTLNPAQLLDSHGKVVAEGGQFITAAGGSPPISTPDRCAAPGQQRFAIESRVQKGR